MRKVTKGQESFDQTGVDEGKQCAGNEGLEDVHAKMFSAGGKVGLGLLLVRLATRSRRGAAVISARLESSALNGLVEGIGGGGGDDAEELEDHVNNLEGD